jgi:hypothetical protein
MSYIIKNYNNTTVRITSLVQKYRDMKNTNRKHTKFDNRFRPIVLTSPTIEWLHAFLLFKVRVKYYGLAYKITLETLTRATIPIIGKLYVIPNNVLSIVIC